MTPKPSQEQTLPLGFAKFLSWTMLVLILVSSMLLSVFIANNARNNLLRKQQEFALLLAENLNHQIYRRFTLPTLIGYGRVALRNQEQYSRLDQVVQNTIHGLHVESLRIYDHDKVVSYSSSKDELGSTELAGIAFTRAIEEKEHSFEIESSVTLLEAMFKYELEPRTFMLRTTYPLRIESKLGRDPEDQKDLPLMGVLEITQDITSDVKSVINFQWLIVLSSLGSSLLLFFILVSIIQRSERILKERMQDKERLERELHQNEKLAGMGRVVASIAHEIRNPLGIISSSAELLLTRPNADELTKNILGAIYDEARRLSQTVHDFLDYARPKAPRKDQVDVSLVLDQTLGFLDHEFTQHGVGVDRRYQNGLFMLGDKDLLYRAFYNIIANGLQAIGTGGTITIDGYKENGHILVIISDTGSGFDLTQLDKMLDPFFTTKDDGTGLGLAIVNSIVTSHGGEMMLSNAAEGGAMVRMRFPAE